MPKTFYKKNIKNAVFYDEQGKESIICVRMGLKISPCDGKIFNGLPLDL